VIQIELWMKLRQERNWLRGLPSRLVLLRVSSPVTCRRSQCSTQARGERGRRTCRPNQPRWHIVVPKAYRPPPRPSISTLPSVTSELDTPFAPVAGRFSHSVWEEYQFGALCSSTDLVHGSLDSPKAPAGLIDVFGLDSNGAGGQGLSNKAANGGKSTSDVPLHPQRGRCTT
jgi:hypothetical protein